MERIFSEVFSKNLFPGSDGAETMTRAEWKKILKIFLKGSHTGRRLGEKEKIEGGMVGGKLWMWKEIQNMTMQEATRYLEFLQSGQTVGDEQLEGLQRSSVLTPAEYKAAYEW